MSDLLFDTPWWLPVTIMMAGFGVFFTGNRHVNAQVRNVGIAIVLAGILLGLVSYYVQTPRERAIHLTRQLVAAYAKRDEAGMRLILDARTSVRDTRGRALADGRDAIVRAAMESAELYDLSNVTITSLNAEHEQTVITVDLSVLFTSARNRGGTGNARLVWEERADGWHLTEIQILQLDGRDPAPYLDFLLR